MKAKDLTIDEKLTLLTGDGNWRLERLGGKLPELFFSDGPCGLRTVREGEHALKATAFPTPSALASTWNRALAREMGELLGEEAIEREVDVLLAPGVNIKRTPCNGRNFEYFSEDPYLAGELAYEYILGVQSKGVGTSVKHFAANNREYDRFYQSSEVDDRTLHEIYLAAFARAAEAKPWTVMCAYNLLNGVYCSEHKKLLKTILREELGFDGVILSDWGAVVDRAKALKATLDLEMPHSDAAFARLKEAYARGEITDEEIDASVDRLLALVEKAQKARPLRKVLHTASERHEAAVRIAAEAAVLLKNDGALPLREGERVFVCGKKAKTGVFGGGGSSCVDSDFSPAPLEELLRKEDPSLAVDGREICFHDWGELHGLFGLREGIVLARNADKAIVVVGCDADTDCEGCDRMQLTLSPVEEDLIRNIAAVNRQTVVVVYGGSAVDMSGWIDCVNAVLYVNFNGEGGNEALAKLLTGAENPSGKLQESFPLVPIASVRGNAFTDVYSEGVFVGYRGYDAAGSSVLFPFGHGLSYSQFVYSDLTVHPLKEGFEVSLKVKNVSGRAGKEVVQLYAGQKFPLISRPVRELKGFEKICLAPGEQTRVVFPLSLRALAYWSPALDGWRTEEGEYTLSVGSSSRDLRLAADVWVHVPDAPSTRAPK